MKPLDKYLETLDELSSTLYDLPLPTAVKDDVAVMLEEITAKLEDQESLRSTEWDA
jgi:hypothetical protein